MTLAMLKQESLVAKAELSSLVWLAENCAKSDPAMLKGGPFLGALEAKMGQEWDQLSLFEKVRAVRAVSGLGLSQGQFEPFKKHLKQLAQEVEQSKWVGPGLSAELHALDQFVQNAALGGAFPDFEAVHVVKNLAQGRGRPGEPERRAGTGRAAEELFLRFDKPL